MYSSMQYLGGIEEMVLIRRLTLCLSHALCPVSYLGLDPFEYSVTDAAIFKLDRWYPPSKTASPPLELKSNPIFANI